jgi:fructokinase
MASTDHPTILLLGEAVVDLISSEFITSLGDASCFNLYAGGQVANLAVNLARLDFHAVLGSCLGKDSFGSKLLDHLNQAGVDTSLVQEINTAPTTLIPVARQTGTPDFSVYRGADQNLQITEDLMQAASKARGIHISAFGLSRDPCRSTILEVLQENQTAGKVISLDPNYHPGIWPDRVDFLDYFKSIFSLVTITKPSLDDSKRIFGSGLDPEVYLEKFLELGPELVILTMGERGALLGTAAGDRYQIRANQIEVVDVTGAGDAFWAGALAGIMRSFSPLESAKLGQAVAEYKIGIMGPITEHLSWEKYQNLAQGVKTSMF